MIETIESQGADQFKSHSINMPHALLAENWSEQCVSLWGQFWAILTNETSIGS